MSGNSNDMFSRLLTFTRLKFALLGLFSLAILAVSLAYFGLSADRPYMGVMLADSGQGWAVQSVDANGLAVRAGIKAGDLPLEINGQPAEVFLKKYQQAGIVFGSQINELTVASESGQVKSATVEGGTPSWQSMTEWATWLFVSIIFWITGFYVFWKRPRNTAAFLLFLCSLDLGLAFSSESAGNGGVPVAPIIAIVSTIIGPWLLLHFFLILPEERSWLVSQKLTYLMYLPAAVTLILFPIWGYADGQPVQWFRTIRLLEIGAAFLGVVAVGIYNYVHSASPRTRQQMRIVLISCLIAVVPFVILSIFPATLLKQYTIPSGFNILFISAIPIGMGYAVLTRRLMDIDLVVRRGIIYTLITLVMAAILSAGIFLTNGLDNSLGVLGKTILALVLGATATALFGPAKKRIEVLVDRLFFKDAYDYQQIIHDMNVSLNALNDADEIARLVVGMVTQTLNLAGACLFVKTQSGEYQISAAQGIFADSTKQDQLMTLISRKDNSLQFPKTASAANPAVSYLISLMAGEKEVGVLCLGRKASRQDFLSSDIYLLQDLASATASALRSAMLTRDVSSRDTFISITSHELRIPLTAISGYADLLLRGNDPEPTRKKWLKNILNANQVINSVIEDLVNVTHIQSGKIALKIEKIKLAPIIRDKVAFARETTRNHEFTVDVEAAIPDVTADRLKLGQILTNLLTNAVKYSPKGGVITVRVCNDVQNRRVVLSVADEGIGISASDRDSLFTLFNRIKRPETQGIDGTGLGLYITRKLAEAMGGEVWVESELNRGSIFYVSVPADENKVGDEKAG
jgi:signal transduction histidine kinase